MKGCFSYVFIFANFIFISELCLRINCNYLRGGTLGEGTNNFSNELVPGLNDVNKLKRIIEDLVKIIIINFYENYNINFYVFCIL
jgi:hypothetical protein